MNERIGWAQHSALRCAIIQLVCGFLALGMGIVSVSIGANGGIFLTGIWTGILFLITGVLGMFAAKKKNTGFIVAFMAMSILSSLAAVCLMSIEVLAAIGDSFCRFDEFAFTSWWWNCPYKALMALHYLMVSVGGVEFIVAIISASLTGRACCCSTPPQTGQLTYVHAAGAVQYMTGSNVQYVNPEDVTPQIITSQYPTQPQHPTAYTNVIQA